MKVMICHSGALSVAVAHAVRTTLRPLFPYGEPFMSDEDIEPGTLWHESLSKVLYGVSESRYGDSPEQGTPPPTEAESPPELLTWRQTLWVQARDADERARLQESLTAAGIQSFNFRQEGNAMGVSWYETSTEEVVAMLKQQGFRVAAIGVHG